MNAFDHAELRTMLVPLEAGVSVNGAARPATDGEVGVLKLSCIKDGSFRPSENKVVDAHERKRVAVSPKGGDVLISRASGSPDLIGTCGLVEDDHPNLFLSDKLWRTRLKSPEKDDVLYVIALLGSAPIRAVIKSRVTGDSAAMKSISQRSFLSISVPRPPKGIQRSFGIASACFKKHESWLERVAEARRQLKRALLQQLMTGARRFQRVDATWNRTALADVTQEVSTRNGKRLGPDRVMGVLKHEGLVPMRERTMADDLSRYKVVPSRAFAYNPMRINIGSIAYSWHPHDVLVSPDYEVFATRPDRLDPRYLDHLRRSEPWASFVKRAGNGSVRVRIYYQDLGQFVFPLPPLGEQRRIATLLDKADEEIALLERQLAAYRQLKRGMMQKLLTGDIAALTESNIATPAPSGSR